MFKWLKDYQVKRKQAKQKEERVRNFRKMLDEIVKVTALNRRSYQLAKYGMCFTEKDIKWLQIAVSCEARPYDSNYKIIDMISDKVTEYENKMEADLKMCVLEYGC